MHTLTSAYSHFRSLFFFKVNASLQDERRELIERNLLDNILKKIKEELQKLQQVISDKINSAWNSVKDIYNKLIEKGKELKDKIIAKGQEVLNALKEKLQGKLDCYKHEAEHLGIDIKDCYSASQNEILALPASFLGNLTSCVTDEIKSGINMMKSAYDAMTSLIQEITNIPGIISECSKHGFWEALKCLGNELKNILSLQAQAAKVVAKIAQLITDMSTFFTGLGARVQTCAAIQTTKLGIAGGVIALKFTTCVAHKFPNPIDC